MMTLGFGDFFPVSNMGRMVGIISCLIGVYIVSVFVLTLQNLIMLTTGEFRSFDILRKLKCKDNLKLKAVAVLKSAQKQRLERNKDDMNVL